MLPAVKKFTSCISLFCICFSCKFFTKCGREFSYCLQNGFEINMFVYTYLTRIVFVFVSLFGPFPHYFRHLQTKLQSGKSLPVPINDIKWVWEYMCNVDKDTLLHRARQQNAHWNFRWTFCCLKMHFAKRFKEVAHQILSSSLTSPLSFSFSSSLPSSPFLSLDIHLKYIFYSSKYIHFIRDCHAILLRGVNWIDIF